MSVRVLFKVDSVDLTQRHSGYERDENGAQDRSKPTVETHATVRLSAAEPAHDHKGEHANTAVWKGRISGNITLLGVSEAIAAGLKNGQEYYIDITPAA